MKRKNIIVLLLITASLLVWSRNIYMIIVGISQNDEESDAHFNQMQWDITDSLITLPDEQTKYVYSGKYRDPFLHWLTRPKKKISMPVKPIIKIKETPKPAQPKLRFSGVLSDSSGMLAIIEGLNGQTYFAHTRDTVEGVVIVQIEKEQVEYQFEGEKFVLPLRLLLLRPNHDSGWHGRRPYQLPVHRKGA